MAGVSNGTIFRVPRRDNYTIMSNVHLRDPNLTWKARGLMSTILSFPPDWDYTLAGLATCAKDNIDSTRTGVLELEAAGYLQRNRQRNPNGTLGRMEYQVYEDPAQNPYFKIKTNHENDEKIKSNNETNFKLKQKTNKSDVDSQFQPELDFPILDNPTLENPILEKPILENPTQLNTHEIKNSLNQKLNQSISSDAAENSNDGLIDRAAELPNGLVNTLDSIGYQFPYSRPESDQELREWMKYEALNSDALRECRIPHSFAKSKPVMDNALRLAASFETYRTEDPFDPIIGIFSALASMATTETAKYNKHTVRAEQVIDKINERIAADGCLMDWLISFQSRWEEIYEERRDKITHRSAYLKSCLWKWLEDSDAETLTDIPAI